MATATTTTLAATSSSGVTATVPASGPSPSSRPSATRSPSNPPPNTRGFSFQESNAPGVHSLALAETGRDAAGGGRYREAVGGAGGVLHPRAGYRPRAVLSGHGESPGRWYGA